MALDNDFERKLLRAGLYEPLSTFLATESTERTAALGKGVKEFSAANLIPAGFVGTAKIGTDLYVGDGTFLKPFSVPNISRKKIKIICVGNSISSQAQTTGNGYYNTTSVLAYVNMLSGNMLDIVETGAATRSDGYGVYGYSGATLASINTDWITNFIPSLDNINYIPDVVWAIELFANDIGQSIPYATSIQEFQIFLRTIQTKWPGVILMLRTCSQSLGWTGSMAIEYNALNTYIKSLDNGKNIFVYNNDFMSDTVNPTFPKYTTVFGTCVGTTLTVNSVVSGPTGIGIGWTVGNTGSNPYITVVNQIGDVGTYTINTPLATDITTAQNIILELYALDGLHPAPWANYLSAKEVVKCLNRFVSEPKETLVVASANPFLTGNVSLSGTGYSGTFPTGVSSASNPANATVVGTALNPGLLLTITNNASSNTVTGGSNLFLLTTYTPNLPVDVFRMFTKVKIISGADYIRSFNFSIRITDNGVVGTPVPAISQASSTTRTPYADGDILDMCTPNIRSGGVGTLISLLRIYFSVAIKEQTPVGSQIVIEIQKAGFYLPEDTSGYITLVAGTATVNAASKILTKSKISLSLKTANNPGALFVSTKTVNTSFVITSTNIADTSTVYWKIENLT